MLKKVGFAIVSLLFSVSAIAQQDPQFSQNMFNRFYTNPGVAGSSDAICATMIGRTQWQGFTGAPNTAVVSLHAPVGILHGGAGLNIVADQIGNFTYTGAKASYAYRQAIGAGTLGIGAAVGFLNLNLAGFDEGQATQGVAIDPNISSSSVSDWSMDFDFGVYYSTQNYYIGLSTTHLQKSQLEDATQGAFNNLSYTIARHYYLQAGYNYQLNANLVLQPSLYLKTEGTTVQTDINCLALYNNSLYGGVSVRLNREIVPMFGYIKSVGNNGTLRIGYSYDIALLHNLGKYNNGSHELLLGYCFTITPTPKVSIHHNVRFL